jgi:hypothetical protein
VATIVAGMVHIVGAGTSTITASQAGDDDFNPAIDVSRLLTVIEAGGGEMITLNPIHDAYVRDNGTQDGTGSSLITKNGYTSWKREAYLMFDLASTGLSSTTNATLKLYCNLYDGGNSELYPVSNDNWTETGITWANKPSSGTMIGSQAGGIGYIEWDVTSFINSELLGNKVVSFRLSASNDAFINFNSKEAASNRPELVLNDQLKSGISAQIEIPGQNEILKNEVLVYPNPFVNGQLTIDLLGVRGEQMKIVNQLGQLIYANKIENRPIHMINKEIFTSPGIYILSVQTTDRIINTRVIVR